METKSIIKQLEKALACKEDKELRLRIEVLVDMLKDAPVENVAPAPYIPVQPAPLPTYYENTPFPKPTVTTIEPKPGKVTSKIKGPGVIVGGEQINYTRPKGT